MIEYYKVLATDMAQLEDARDLHLCQKSVFDTVFDEGYWDGLLSARQAQAWATYCGVRGNFFRLKAKERSSPRLAEDLAILLAWNTRPIDEEYPEMGFALVDLVTAVTRIQQAMLTDVDHRAKGLAVDVFNLSRNLKATAPIIERWGIEQAAKFTTRVAKIAKGRK